jgi:enterochelin esterase-like enzyme/sugar lactone lactonase YvrE
MAQLASMPVCRFGSWPIVLATALTVGRVEAEGWEGPFTIVPVSAPGMVLEAVAPGNAEGNTVSIGKPTGAPNQTWTFTRAGQDLYTVRPGTSPTLVLAIAGGGMANGALAVLETDAGKPWQRWSVKANVNGSFSLVPQHAPGKGLDDFGGGSTPGARQDLWDYNPADEHLQWVLRPLPGATLPAEFATRRLDPLAIPKGTTKDFAFASSAIFPGTRRTGTVFIPAQYDAAKPACVYVRQDGYNPAEKGILEALIAAGDMPVTVGVFVRPGELPAPMPDTLGRRNRCFEYDAVGDAYVRFLVDELLPFVAKEFNLNLSTSGNDRCIAGGSSGGISAFNAAWQRPDAFSRVYANSGSFVAFRGGHEFPTLIRKTEAKPIRAYLTTGTLDMENCAGDWYLIDLEMEKALKFAGYDFVFQAIEGPHVAGWNEHFPEAMRFIWKGWPAPVQAGTSAPRVQDVLIPGEGWVLAAKGFRDTRSPASNARGEVFFADSAANKVFRIGLDGKIEEFLADAGQANGLAVGPQGELYSVSELTGKVLCYAADGGPARLCAEGIRGCCVLARHDGTLYVTGAGEGPGEGSRVWCVKEGHATVVDTGPKRATGLASRPDQWLLAVADGGSKWVYSYQVNPDGSLANRERFFWLHVPDWEDDAGAESVCYAREGQMLVATRSGVQICADDGPTQGILPLPGNTRVTGLCFGGPEQDTLFAFCGDTVWKRRVKLHASGAFSPWTSVKGTPL